MAIQKAVCIFVTVIKYKVTVKRMTKAKKNYKQPWRGSYIVIARKVGCTPQYVSMVLNSKLGKYSERNSDLVKRIKKVNREVEALFEA